jgi:cbb3-type cytochrome oxidase subunit 3
MYREFYAALPSTLLPIVVMAFFLVAFVVVVLRTFVLKRRRDYDGVAALPLADDPHPESVSVPAAPAPHEVTR